MNDCWMMKFIIVSEKENTMAKTADTKKDAKKKPQKSQKEKKQAKAEKKKNRDRE